MESLLQILQRIDHDLLVILNSKLTFELFDKVMPAITDLHKSVWFFPIVIALVYALFQSRYSKDSWKLVLALLVTVASADFVSNHFTKKVFERPRPFVTYPNDIQVRSPAGGSSFVSNHAVNMFTTASFISFFAPGVSGIVYTFAAIIGYSRIYNGVHYPSDVVAGALLGILWGAMMARIWKRLLFRSKKS